jgi:hypothetical protein
MHLHANQINPNAELNAVYAAAKTAATPEARRTRKKVLELASKLAGESDSGDACVVRLGAHEQSQDQAKQQNQQNQGNGKKPEERADFQDACNSISDWA